MPFCGSMGRPFFRPVSFRFSSELTLKFYSVLNNHMYYLTK
ncbi:uncharacterized protein J3R85_001529 [Psidium guajava]|nr:uncharacterized protein J3R85_001529 [Psidium guajava]